MCILCCLDPPVGTTEANDTWFFFVIFFAIFVTGLRAFGNDDDASPPFLSSLDGRLRDATSVGDDDAENMTRNVFRVSGAASRNSVTRDDFVDNMTFDDSSTEKLIVDLAQGVVQAVCGVK